MRHLKGGRKLNRTREHRKAMFENMATALLEHGRIETTVAKAKALRPVAERVITLAKNNDLHARKMAFSIIPKGDVVKRLFDVVAPSFKDRPGGYTRVIRTHTRRGDAAPMAILELVNYEAVSRPAAGGKAEKAAKPAKAEAKKPEKAAKAGKKEKPPKPAKPEKDAKKEKARKQTKPGKYE